MFYALPVLCIHGLDDENAYALYAINIQHSADTQIKYRSSFYRNESRFFRDGGRSIKANVGSLIFSTMLRIFHRWINRMIAVNCCTHNHLYAFMYIYTTVQTVGIKFQITIITSWFLIPNVWTGVYTKYVHCIRNRFHSGWFHTIRFVLESIVTSSTHNIMV